MELVVEWRRGKNVRLCYYGVSVERRTRIEIERVQEKTDNRVKQKPFRALCTVQNGACLRPLL